MRLVKVSGQLREIAAAFIVKVTQLMGKKILVGKYPVKL